MLILMQVVPNNKKTAEKRDSFFRSPFFHGSVFVRLSEHILQNIKDIVGDTLRLRCVADLLQKLVDLLEVQKLRLVVCLVGLGISIGGSVAFVGLIIPHMIRLAAGPNHRKLLPLSAFAGAVFLMLADLAARSLLSPIELPIGVVTSLIGAVVFIVIFYRSRKGGVV